MKRQNEKSRFQTHIPEPRWQQVVSLVLVVVVVLLYVWWVIFNVIKK